MPKLTLEAEEWYVLAGWLRERENRLMYALRPKSDDWEFVRDLRRTIERQQDGGDETPEASRVSETTETAGVPESIRLSDRQVAYLSRFLRRRARKLLLFPWRSRERRDVRHLRDHLLHEADRSEDPSDRATAGGRAVASDRRQGGPENGE